MVENLSLILLDSRSRAFVSQLFHLSNGRLTPLVNSQLTCLEPEWFPEYHSGKKPPVNFGAA